MMGQTTKVEIPKKFGKQIVFRYRGTDPVTYEVRDGSVNVENEHLDTFLRALAGSKAVAGNTSDSDKGDK
jgi:hypothetical protein